MSTEIRQADLRNDNALIMRRVADGESFTVTVNGRPVADVVPHQRDTGRRRFVPAAELGAVFDASPLSKEEAARWWHDIREGGDDVFGPDIPEDPWEREANRRQARRAR
ncbi:MAG: type II toxin-antitoxin system Phd/YefM family antitoxin [Sciscionella sp.]